MPFTGGNVAGYSGDHSTQHSEHNHQEQHQSSEYNNDLNEQQRDTGQYVNKTRYPLLPQQQQHFQQQLEHRLVQNFDNPSSNNPPEYKYEPTGGKTTQIASIIPPTSSQSHNQQLTLTGNSSGQILESHSKVDQWLLNQFKIATEAALDLRSTPLLSHLQHHHLNPHQHDDHPLLQQEQQGHCPLEGRTDHLEKLSSQTQQNNQNNVSATDSVETQMTTEVHLQLQHLTNNRSLFKMETDFWQQPRGPPIGLASVSHHHSHLQHQHQQHVHHQNHQSLPLFNAIGTSNAGETNNSTGPTSNNMTSNSDSIEANNATKSVTISENATSAITRPSDSNCGHPRSPLQNTSNSDQNNHQSANSPTPNSAHLHHQLQHQINHHIQQQQQADSSQNEPLPNGAETVASGASNITTPVVPLGHQITPNHLQQMQQLQQQQSIIQQQQSQHSQSHQQHQNSPQLNLSQQQAAITATALAHPPQSLTPSGGSSTPDIKFNSEKLVNEIQV